MKSQTNTKLYEQIPHITDSAPYSIHYTQVAAETEPALYLHWHKELEFLLLTEGTLSFQIEDRSFLLHAGDAVFIPPEALHSAKNAGNTAVAFYAFVCSPEFIFSSFDASYNTYVLPVLHNNLLFATALQPDISWQGEILQTLHCLFFSGVKSELYLRGQLLLLWNTLYHHHIISISGKYSLHALSEQLEPAIRFIQNNYQQALSLDELASCVHLSEGQFCRTFKHLTGMTPFQYLVRYRILQSCQELSSTGKKITDIATTHGFNNISYYNRAFFKVMNMTPTEYRRQFLTSPFQF